MCVDLSLIDRGQLSEQWRRRFGLTPRECDVGWGLAQGWSNVEIGRVNFIGVETVKTHVAHVMRKVGESRRVRLALVLRLLPDVRFDVALDDGRVGHCWRACIQEYSNCAFSAGLVEGVAPDEYYLRLERDTDDEPLTIFLRRDEATAILYALSGALWSGSMIALDDKRTMPGEKTLDNPPER